MAELAPQSGTELVARPDQPLIGLLIEVDGREVVRYFTDEAAADAAMDEEAVQVALSLAGAWSDLEWADMEDGLERIRHESRPTPPIELDL